MLNTLKVYLNVNGKIETFFMDVPKHYVQVLKQAEIRFKSQRIAKVVVVTPGGRIVDYRF